MKQRNGSISRLLGGRATRRSVLRGAAYGSAGVAAMIALACGGDNKSGTNSGGSTSNTSGAANTSGTAAASEGQPKPGGTARYAQTASLNDVMDPHTSLNQGAQLWSFIGNTALRLSQDATKVVPELVDKWETPGDGTEMVLTIHPGVTWHDKPPVSKRAFDAEDLAYNLNRIAGKLNPNEIARFQRRSDFEGFNKAEAVDASKVKVTFDRPASTFLNGLTDFRNQLVPRDFLDKGGKFEDPASLVGTGPFVLDSWKDLEKAVYKRNPNYWKQGFPYLDEVNWVWFGDPLSVLTAFTKGDVVAFSPNRTQRQTIKQTVSGAQEEIWVFGNWNHLRFNLQRKPFDDARVRRALQLTINYKNNNDAFYDNGYWDYTGPCPAAFPDAIQPADVAKLPGWNPDSKDADTKTAKDLMTAAGFPDGKLTFKILPPITDQTSVYYDFVIRTIDQWKKVWPAMQAQIDPPPDGATFARRQVQGDFDVISYVIFPQPDAWLELSSQYLSTGSRNYGKFKDDRIDSLLNTAFSQLDVNQRKSTLMDVQKALINEHMAIITTGMPRQNTFFGKNVRGMKGYGGRADGGGYDTQRHTEHLWFAG